MSRKRIGELLLERGAVTRQQLDAGLLAQQRTRQRLGVTLIQLGTITEVQLAQVLAQSLGLATVDLMAVQVDWSAVHLLRARFCETHELFPFAIDKSGARKRVMVALSDPLNQTALDEIEFTTGLDIAPYVSTHSQIRAAILRFYHKVTAEEASQASVRLASEALPPPDPDPSPPDEPPMVVGEEIISKSNLIPDEPFSRPVEPLEKLEHRFWTLMRLLERKGVVGRAEFLAALGDEDE